MFKIQHSKKHVRILKIMETLVGMTFQMTHSIVIMSSSDYDRNTIKNKKKLKVPVKMNKLYIISML